MRFIAQAATPNTNVTYQNLLDTFLLVTSAVAGYDLFSAVRIRAVEVWASAVLGNANTVAVTFLGNVTTEAGKPQIFQDTSMGVEPAHVRAVPAAKSTLAFWQVSSSDVAFQLTCPAGAVIDLELSFINRYGNSVAAQNALVAAPVGAVVTRGFDGLAIAATNFVPQNPIYNY